MIISEIPIELVVPQRLISEIPIPLEVPHYNDDEDGDLVDNFKKWFLENQKSIAIGCGSVAGLGILYKLLKR